MQITYSDDTCLRAKEPCQRAQDRQHTLGAFAPSIKQPPISCKVSQADADGTAVTADLSKADFAPSQSLGFPKCSKTSIAADTPFTAEKRASSRLQSKVFGSPSCCKKHASQKKESAESFTLYRGVSNSQRFQLNHCNLICDLTVPVQSAKRQFSWNAVIYFFFSDCRAATKGLSAYFLWYKSLTVQSSWFQMQIDRYTGIQC